MSDAPSQSNPQQSGPEQSATEQPRTEAPAFDRRMIEALICPLTHGPLTYDSGRGALISRMAGLAFPIREGIPIMLESEAVALDQP